VKPWIYVACSILTWLIFWVLVGSVLHISALQLSKIFVAWIACKAIADGAYSNARKLDLQKVLRFEFSGWEADRDIPKAAHRADPTLEVRYSEAGIPILVRKKLTEEQQVVVDRIVSLLERTIWQS